jgi:alpha-tubulin suppressor-like RCC1 family protein
MLLGAGGQVQWQTPTQIGANSSWSQLSVHNDVVCAIRTDKTLWCMGDNTYGALGVGDKVNRTTMTAVGSSADWSNVSTGGSATCAVKTTGSLWCWGYNVAGDVIYPNPPPSTFVSPTQVGTGTSWIAVMAGGWDQCGIKTDHSLWCRGWSPVGLGTPPTVSGHPDIFEQYLTQVAPGSQWSDVVISVNNYAGNSICGSQANGEIRCWAWNWLNQLSTDSSTQPYLGGPAKVTGVPALHGLSLHNQRVCGLNAANGVVCWGGERDDFTGGG